MINTINKPRSTEQIRNEIWGQFHKTAISSLINDLANVIADNEARIFKQAELESELAKLKETKPSV